MQTTAKRAWHRLRTLAPEYALYPLIVLIVLLVMGAFTGRFLTTDNPYGSYTIQACAWLEGHLDVNPNFTWLELAEYGGKFYDIKRIDNYEGYTDDISLYCKLSNDQNIEVTEPDAASV